MATQTLLTRRHFVRACAASAALISMPARAAVPLHPWRGLLFGTEVRMQLASISKQRARKLFSHAIAEAKRLENLFTLYDSHSELSQLNLHGKLTNPSREMVDILTHATHYSAITNGAFNATVNIQKDHIPNAVISMAKLHISAKEIAFAQPRMRLTLNAIAQGYITDKVAELLQHEQVPHALIELGETRAIGTHPTGRSWQVVLRGSGQHVALNNQSLAVSSLISPNTGKRHIVARGGEPLNAQNTVAVIADNATKADALATALVALPHADAQRLAAQTGVQLI